MPASPADIRKIVEIFVCAVNQRDFKSVAPLFAPEARWIVLANGTKADWGGIFAATDMLGRAQGVLDPFETWSYQARDIIVDTSGKIAVCDAVGNGKGPGPLTYDNNYMMKFTFDDYGKITEIKETLDCYEVEIMFESMKAHSEETGWKGIEGVRTF